MRTLKQAREALETEEAELADQVVQQAVDIFSSTTEYEPSQFWQIRKICIELAKIRQIREAMAGEG